MFKIAIPSLSRIDKIKKKTLKYLDECNIDKKLIYIFVIKEEYQQYKDALPDYNIIIGEKGICNQINFIFNYFNDGDYIIRFDDDINRLELLNKETLKFDKLLNLNELFNRAYNDCLENMTILWGLIHGGNAYWLRNAKEIVYNSNYVCGGCYGIIIDKDFKTKCLNDDIELGLYVKETYGCMIKYNTLSVNTTSRNKGGCEWERNNESEFKSLNKLKEIYPQFINKIIKTNKPKFPFKIYWKKTQ
jgi:hypothetical protein